jgi:formamidopyrimidine-DNA glycosylase
MEGARFEKVVARRPDLRFPLPIQFTSRLEGSTIRTLGRRGKYLVTELSSGEVLVMHLGMSGSFRVELASGETTPGAHDHVVFCLSSGARVTFNDPRRFGSMDLVSGDELRHHRALSRLGPEPLDAGFDAAVLAQACRGRKTSLKAVLSDQRVVAGLGNIYVCEALHRARLSPRRRASTLATRIGEPREAACRLTTAIKKVLDEAVARGIRWQQQADAGGDAVYFPSRFRVYDRKGKRCVRAGCKGIVRRIVQAGRATFFCPVCQR